MCKALLSVFGSYLFIQVITRYRAEVAALVRVRRTKAAAVDGKEPSRIVFEEPFCQASPLPGTSYVRNTGREVVNCLPGRRLRYTNQRRTPSSGTRPNHGRTTASRKSRHARRTCFLSSVRKERRAYDDESEHHADIYRQRRLCRAVTARIQSSPLATAR